MQKDLAAFVSLPFEVGDSRSFAGLTIVHPRGTNRSRADYVGSARSSPDGLTVADVDKSGVVETLLVVNRLASLGSCTFNARGDVIDEGWPFPGPVQAWSR